MEEEEETTKATLNPQHFATGHKRKRRHTVQAQLVMDALFPASASTPVVPVSLSVTDSASTPSSSAAPSASSKGKTKGRAKSSAPMWKAKKRRRTEPLHDVPRFDNELFPANASTSALPPVSHGKKGKSRGKGWTHHKGDKVQRRPKAQETVSQQPAQGEMVAGSSASALQARYWEVLVGYNGPCEWPEAIVEGAAIADVSSYFMMSAYGRGADWPLNGESLCNAALVMHGITSDVWPSPRTTLG